MAEQPSRRQTLPDLPAKSYLDLRKRFQAAPPSQVTAPYLESVLNVGPKAAQNILPQIRALGLIDEEGKLTEVAHDWRSDDHLGRAVAQIRERVYRKNCEMRTHVPILTLTVWRDG